MSWKPIVAGVDPSEEGIVAAAVARRIAELAGTDYHLVHVTRDVSDIPASLQLPVDLSELRDRVSERARNDVRAALAEQAPEVDADRLELRLGTPAWGLKHAIQDHEAGLLVLGRKRHHAPVRWFGGSTAHQATRSIEIPILLAAKSPVAPVRILAAIDLSYAAPPTLELARRMVDLMDGKLKVLHVAEPLPLIPDAAFHLDVYAHFPAVEAEFDKIVSATLEDGTAIREIRRGVTTEVVQDEAASWEADLVVVGSHGKNRVDRVLLGSTTERLLNLLATSILVVPVRAPKGTATRAYPAVVKLRGA